MKLRVYDPRKTNFRNAQEPDWNKAKKNPNVRTLSLEEFVYTVLSNQSAHASGVLETLEVKLAVLTGMFVRYIEREFDTFDRDGLCNRRQELMKIITDDAWEYKEVQFVAVKD
jgi:hypothetical protein